MAFYLRQSTASQEIPLGVFVDETDGFTAEAALSIANTDIKIWKTGATTLANKTSGGATVIAGGSYYAVLDATDTDTLGPLQVIVHKAGARPVILECLVVTANVYDSMVLGTDLLDVSVVQVAGSTTNVSALATGVAAVKVVTDQLVAVHAEPTGVPAANETPLDKLAYLFMALRNKVTVTATKKTFFDDGDAAEWEQDLSDDGTTFTQTEANAI